MLNELIDVNMKGSQLYPSGLHEKFNAMLDSVDGSDYAPPKQARDVETMLTQQLEQLKRTLCLEEGSIADFCQEIATTGLQQWASTEPDECPGMRYRVRPTGASFPRCLSAYPGDLVPVKSRFETGACLTGDGKHRVQSSL